MARKLTHWLAIYWLEILIVCIGIIHQILEKLLQIRFAWADNYLDDLLAVPFVSACVLWMENFLVYRNHQRVHSFYQLFFLFVFISLLFEWIIPHFSTDYFYDPIDIVYYFIGFIAYYLAKKKSQ
jgi:hypothetical protein